MIVFYKKDMGAIMKRYRDVLEIILTILSIILIFICSNSYFIFKRTGIYWFVFVFLFLGAVALSLFTRQKFPNTRLKICKYGTKYLIIFVASTVCTIIFNFASVFVLIPDNWMIWCINALTAYLVEAVVFWIGIICVYCTSVQLGIGIRVWGLICGMVPVANIFMLSVIIRTTLEEINFEWQKYMLNISRKDERVCATKYPLLMVHGVFFRDSAKFNYWGRVPKELENNGARIFYGEHQSADSIENSAAELAERIQRIIRETDCGKVNIIAHSKGGLDCRYAINKYNLEKYVASLTTINTPHKGCKFADYILNKAPETFKNKLADTYNSTLRRIGDVNPDFLAAVSDLASERAVEFDSMLPLPVGVFCQSTGSKLNNAVGGKFPLNLSYNFVKNFDGFNDGLVGEQSFKWGENFMFLSTTGRRGISHGDMIDLNRENIPGFDVREWYVKLVSDLKNRGL